MDTVTLQAIQVIGYPIISAISMAGFSGFLIKWILRWILNRDETRYNDNRKDMKELTAGFTNSIETITTTFQKELKKKELYQMEINGRVNKNHTEIMDVLDDISSAVYDTRKLITGKKEKNN